MKDKVWEALFEGTTLRVTNRMSLLPARTSEHLQVDGEMHNYIKERSMRKAKRWMASIFLALFALSINVVAQENPVLKKVQALDWKDATAVGNIAGKATFRLEGGLRLLDSANTTDFLTLNGNLPQTDMFTVATRNLNWFSVLRFVDEGYVKDDDKIDADALLVTLKENNAASAGERKKRGLPGLFMEGWFIPPRYDSETKRLEWATLLRNDNGEKSVNFSTKILGRTGHMDVILVSDPQSLEADIKEFKNALKGFEYVAGERYSEWKQGEKVAAYVFEHSVA